MRITKEKIISVLEALADVNASWADAAEDDDSGRPNHLLFLAISDDGSGSLGTAYLGLPDPCNASINVQFEFATPEDVAPYIAEWAERMSD